MAEEASISASSKFGYSGNPKDIYENARIWSFRKCDYTGSTQSFLISKMLCIRGQTGRKRMGSNLKICLSVPKLNKVLHCSCACKISFEVNDVLENVAFDRKS